MKLEHTVTTSPKRVNPANKMERNAKAIKPAVASQPVHKRVFLRRNFSVNFWSLKVNSVEAMEHAAPYVKKGLPAFKKPTRSIAAKKEQWALNPVVTRGTILAVNVTTFATR